MMALVLEFVHQKVVELLQGPKGTGPMLSGLQGVQMFASAVHPPHVLRVVHSWRRRKVHASRGAPAAAADRRRLPAVVVDIEVVADNGHHEGHS